MSFVQVKVDLKARCKFESISSVLTKLDKSVKGIGKSLTTRSVNIIIYIKYKDAQWKTIGSMPAKNPEVPLSQYSAWVKLMEGVVFEKEEQVVSLAVSSFYSDRDEIIVIVNEV